MVFGSDFSNKSHPKGAKRGLLSLLQIRSKTVHVGGKIIMYEFVDNLCKESIVCWLKRCTSVTITSTRHPLTIHQSSNK